MTIDELLTMIDEDLTINHSNLQDKIYKVPNYHSKYLRLYFQYKEKFLKENQKLDKMYRDKYHYYSGTSDNCYEFTLDKKEIQFHILSDDEYSEQNLKVEKLKLIVESLDRTLKRVMYLGNDIKSILSYINYLNGV